MSKLAKFLARYLYESTFWYVFSIDREKQVDHFVDNNYLVDNIHDDNYYLEHVACLDGTDFF